jgi:hypothetical protein
LNNFKYILILFLVSSFFYGCHQQKETTKRPIKGKSTSFLLEQAQTNEFRSEGMSLKLDVAFKTTKMSDSFKMYIRTKTDSVIWISATYYAVEVARIYITPDSVKFMDRKANKYFVGDMSFLNDKFELELDFYTLQAIIYGNTLGLEDPEKIKSYIADGYYQLSSLGKRKIRKLDKDDNSNNEEEIIEKLNADMVFSTSLYPNTYKVSKLSLHDLSQNKSLLLKYSNHTNVEGQLFPQKIAIEIQSDNNMTVAIDYMKIQAGKDQKFPFTIPEKYELIEYK